MSEFMMNPSASFVDLATYGHEFSSDLITGEKEITYLPQLYTEVESFNKLKKEELFLYTERPMLAEADEVIICDKKEDKKEEEQTSIVKYKFQVKKVYELTTHFSIYFTNTTKLNIDNIVDIKVYTIDKSKTEDKEVKIVYETISREFIKCWFDLFHQSSSYICHTSSTSEFYLPIFLNRYNLPFYNTTERSPLTIEITFKTNSSLDVVDKNLLYFYYKGLIISNKDRQSIKTKITTTPHYYFYDSIQDLTFGYLKSSKKWISCNQSKYYKNRIMIDLRFEEPFHRLSDLFIVVRKGNNKSKNEVVEEEYSNKVNNKNDILFKSFSIYYEETCLYRIPSNLCGTLLSPVLKKSNPSRNFSFANEIIGTYYLPFSSYITVGEEYSVRPYTNTKGVANMSLAIELIDGIITSDLDDYEVCLCYMSPVMK